VTRRNWVTAAVALLVAPFAIRFAWTFPWAQTLETLDQADFLLLAGACLINLLSLVAKGGTWYLLLRPYAPSSLRTAQAATFVGAAVNSISVSVSGEAARAQLVNSRDGTPFSTLAASLVLTRIVEGIALVIFLALALTVVPPWPGARMTALALAGTALAVAVVYRLMPWTRWRGSFSSMAAPARWQGLAGATALAVVNWIAQWCTYHWSIAATHTPTTPAISLGALVMANIAGIPRLTPGNVGVLQGALVLGLGAFHVPPADALAAGLALQAVQVIPVLLIGIALAGRHGFRRLAARRSEAS
jgi:uncharacterized membrane protein YbhN (UPF0104 family)